jgi:hypothetical protein
MKTLNKPTKTQKIVYSMLIENTGSHFLDSGGAYGRNHERNAKKSIKDFMNEEEERITFDGKYLDRTVSVFHYLSGLDTDFICDKFNRLNKNTKDWDSDFWGTCEKAGNFLNSENDEFAFKVIREFNTYNGDSDLSQILQGYYLRNELTAEDYFLLQVHGGCDARGGYSDARLFKQDYYSGGIHEYLMEYKSEYELIDDIKEDYTTIIDYTTKEVLINSEVLNLMGI